MVILAPSVILSTAKDLMFNIPWQLWSRPFVTLRVTKAMSS